MTKIMLQISTDELTQAHNWAEKNFERAPRTNATAPIYVHKQESEYCCELRERITSNPPFSFIYDGKSSDELLGTWEFKETQKELDKNRIERTQTYFDPTTGLELRCVIVEYSDFPVVEWTLYFKNIGDKNTPILESIRGLDTKLQRSLEGEFVLHGNKGDYNTADSYKPFDETLAPDTSKWFAPREGKGTCWSFPYYNLQMPGGGLILAIGWPGQWSSSFIRDDKTGLRITAGQELTHLYLKPGEEIRSPLIVLLFWNGTDTIRAQNIWRRWMVEHNLPRTSDGKLGPVQLCGINQHTTGFTGITEQNQIECIKRYVEEGLELDSWWIDTGWYVNSGHWWYTGTWEIERSRLPNGLRPIFDYAHSKGMKSILWFEPERIGDADSWLAKNHPEWIFEWKEDGMLLDLGNPEAREWLIDFVDKFITEQGIDIYRQDFNMAPLNAWRHADAPDRQGIAENFHNQGYLKFWDTILERHPDVRIDACASGGRRNDLETMRRAVPLHRTDYNFDPTSQQCHNFGLSSWFPYTGTGYIAGKSVIEPPDCPNFPVPDDFDTYFFRSSMCACISVNVDLCRTDMNYDLARRLFAEYKQIGQHFLDDFYPLLDYSLDLNVWMAWQYDNPESGKGMVQAFRRAENNETSRILKLRSLDPDVKYEIKNFDIDEPVQMSGKDLMEKGLTVEINEAPGAALIAYKRI